MCPSVCMCGIHIHKHQGTFSERISKGRILSISLSRVRAHTPAIIFKSGIRAIDTDLYSVPDPSYGKPCILYDPESKGSQSYLRLAKELLELEQ